MLTAAAADENQRDDEDPDPVIVKYVAQTVIHGEPPKYEMGRDHALSNIIICRSVGRVRAKDKFLSWAKNMGEQNLMCRFLCGTLHKNTKNFFKY